MNRTNTLFCLALVAVVGLGTITTTEARGRDYRERPVELALNQQLELRDGSNRVAAGDFFAGCGSTIVVNSSTTVSGSVSDIPTCQIMVTGGNKLTFKDATLDFAGSLNVEGGRITVKDTILTSAANVSLDAYAKLEVENSDIFAMSGLLALDSDGQTKIDFVDLHAQTIDIHSTDGTEVKDADVIATGSLTIDSSDDTKVDYVLFEGTDITVCASGDTKIKVSDIIGTGVINVDASGSTEVDEVLFEGMVVGVCASGDTKVKKSLFDASGNVEIDATGDTTTESSRFWAESVLIDASGETKARGNDFTGVPDGMVTITGDECDSDDNVPDISCT